MSKLRTSLKNKFIRVNNNYSSSLRAGISNRTTNIPLVTTPTAIGNFGYITINNGDGGEVVFYSQKSANSLICDLGDRGRDKTSRVGREGGTLVQQRVIAANVSQNQRALMSVARFDSDFNIGRRTADPNGDNFELGHGGYTGYDSNPIRSVKYKGTSGQYSLGRELKRKLDNYSVMKMAYSGQVRGSCLNDVLTIQGSNRGGDRVDSLFKLSQYQARTNSRLDIGVIRQSSANKLYTPRVTSSALTRYTDRGGTILSSRIGNGSKVMPMVIAAKDILFIQQYRNIHTLTDNNGIGGYADPNRVIDDQTQFYGTTMNTRRSQLQNKVQLFNVRSSSKYQPYTVVSTHYDSRIDSQLIRKDDDFFMSLYSTTGTQSTTGGKLSVRYSVGSGASGQRWRLAYNKNLLVDGSRFSQGRLNDAITAWSSFSDITATTRSWRTAFNNLDITNIYQTVLDRGWIYLNTTQRYTRDYYSKYTYADFDMPTLCQFVSYSDSQDKLGLLNISFYGICSNGTEPSVTSFALGVTPVCYTALKPTTQYAYKTFQDSTCIISNVMSTSITAKSMNTNPNSTIKYLRLYSATRNINELIKTIYTNSGSGQCNVVGLMFCFSYTGAGVKRGYFTNIKLQQGLQATRYIQEKPRLDFGYDLHRKQTVIQSRDYNGQNLFIGVKSIDSTTPRTASINFGNFIPYGRWQTAPYNVNTYDKHFTQGGSGGFGIIYEKSSGQQKLKISGFNCVDQLTNTYSNSIKKSTSNIVKQKFCIDSISSVSGNLTQSNYHLSRVQFSSMISRDGIRPGFIGYSKIRTVEPSPRQYNTQVRYEISYINYGDGDIINYNTYNNSFPFSSIVAKMPYKYWYINLWNGNQYNNNTSIISCINNILATQTQKNGIIIFDLSNGKIEIYRRFKNFSKIPYGGLYFKNLINISLKYFDSI